MELTNSIGETTTVKSKVAPKKTSSLFETPTQEDSPAKMYAIRSAYLPTDDSPEGLPYSLLDIGVYLILFSKAASAAEAPVMRKMYVIASGSDLYCTTIPLIDSSIGLPPAEYTTKNVVIAHYLKLSQKGQYSKALFEGFENPYQIPSTTITVQ